jgi:hypothetical protein
MRFEPCSDGLRRQGQVPRRLPAGEHGDRPGYGALFRAIPHALRLPLMTMEIAALDALDLLVVVDNESDTLSSVDKGVPQLPELGATGSAFPAALAQVRPQLRRALGGSVPRLSRLFGLGPLDAHDLFFRVSFLCHRLLSRTVLPKITLVSFGTVFGFWVKLTISYESYFLGR